MTQADKTYNRKSLPDRIQSLREAINYFDENPMLGDKRIARVEPPQGAEARFRHPSAGEVFDDTLRANLMPTEAALDPGRFSQKNAPLPTDRFQPLMANNVGGGNIASKPRSRDSVSEGDRINTLDKSNRDGSHNIGWSDAGSLLGSLTGNTVCSGFGHVGAVAGGAGGYYLGGYGPGLLRETGRAVGRNGFKGDLSGLR